MGLGMPEAQAQQLTCAAEEKHKNTHLIHRNPALNVYRGIHHYQSKFHLMWCQSN